jgi:hypothetical protein
LLLGENTFEDSQIFPEAGADNWKFKWQQFGIVTHRAGPGSWRTRTRRPLPPPPPTFEYDGKTWNSHVPGDPCPVGDSIKVEALYVYGGRYECGVVQEAAEWNWKALSDGSIIGCRIPDEPQEETAKLRERIAELEEELKQANLCSSTGVGTLKATVHRLDQRLTESLDRIAELEQQLATALTPRPIAEAGEVKEGFVRLYGDLKPDCGWTQQFWKPDTHFIDIRLPQPNPRAEYERAVAEAGGAFEAWLKAKGGVK